MYKRSPYLAALGFVGIAIALCAAGAFTPTALAEDGKWVELWQDAFKGMTDPGFDPERISALPAVDRTTGDTYLSMWNYGIWKSADEGKSFSRIDGGKIAAPGCGPIHGNSFYIHPEGKKIVTFNMNNAPGPSGFSTDGGASWTSFESVERNWDFGAMDWDSQTVFAARHEDDGLHVSGDAGKTWTRLAKSRGPVSGLCVAGKSLLLSSAKGIERSDDDGKTWKDITALTGFGPAVEFNGKLWWLSSGGHGVLVSADKGATWAMQCVAAPGSVEIGPFFGKDENHIVVAGRNGFFETADGCKTWKLAVPLPDDFKLFGAAFDPIHDIFYVTGFNLPVMKFTRGRKPEYAIAPTDSAGGSHSIPKAEFVETAKLKVRCTVGISAAVNGNYYYVGGEDGLIRFKRDTQTGKLAFVEQTLESKSGGFTIAFAGGRMYGVTPHDGSKRMSWHGLAWFDMDAESGRAVRKGIVECPASRQMIVGLGEKDLYLKSCGGEQNKVFWYRIGDDGKPVKSGEVTGAGIGASDHNDYPGNLVTSKDGKNIYTVSSRDYSIACIKRDTTGAITYASATSLAPVAKPAPDNSRYQWVSLAISPDGAWLYASVRNGKPSKNFYGIFKRNQESGELTFQETISGEQDALANMKGWNMLFSPTGTGGYLGSFTGPLTTFGYDAKTGHLTNPAVLNETKGNGTSIMALDSENGMLYITGREYTYDQIFSLKADKNQK